MRHELFTSKNVIIMTMFGVLSSLVTLTTAFIPAPLPGLYAVIAVPIGTIFLFMAREIVGKTGAATITQFVSGILSTFLPGGPPVVFIVIPTWVIGGIVVDLLFYFTRYIHKSKATYGIAGIIYNIPGDFILYWAFITFLGFAWPLYFFLYGFIAIHAILGGIAGIFFPDIMKRIEPIITQSAR
jgi:ABC-type thiamin/hydroxymethylpyrimidine transport system permease subunit